MLISVIIPFHRNIEDLFVAVNSINNQAINKNDIEFEILIGNDSEINSSQLESLLKEKSIYPIKVIKNKLAKGAGNARNQGIEKAKGTYLAFLDSDDKWHPTKIACQVKLLLKGYNFITTAYQYKGKYIKLLPPEKIRNYKSFFFNKSVGTSTVIAKKDLIGENRFSNLKFCQDILFWSKLAKSYYFRYCSLEETLVTYSLEGRTSTSSYLIQLSYFFKACLLANLSLLETSVALLHYGVKGMRNKIIRVMLAKINYYKFLKINMWIK